MPRLPLPTLVGALVLVAPLIGCRALGSYLDYRELTAHELRHDDIRVDRIALDVDVHPEAASLSVRARIGLLNEGRAAFSRVELLANSALALRGVACGGVDLDVRTDALVIGDLALARLGIVLATPLAAGARTELELDYTLALPAQEGALIGARSGWVRSEALWVPVVHTILSRRGMDRAPCELTVTLPDTLEPVGLGDFTKTAAADGRARFAAASAFPFQPFFAYGAFRRLERGEGDDLAVAYVLDGSTDEDGATDEDGVITTWLDAARTARRFLEASFGARALPGLKLVFVDGLQGAWGAPFCVLADPSMLSAEREEALWVLGHELAHTWWGDSVAIGGALGYVHEGLANASAIFLLGHELGADVEPRYRRLLLRRFCAPEEPLTKPLAELTIVDPDYKRAAYNLGGLFYCALDERLGRERFLADLCAFARAYDGRAADLATLERFLVEERQAPVADLFAQWTRGLERAAELWAARPELLAEAQAYWASADATIDAAQRAAAEAELAAVVAELRAALEAGEEPWTRVRDRWNHLSLADPAQVTVLDTSGRYVFHVQDLQGDALWYSDARGESVYGRILASDANEGSFGYYAFLDGLGESARGTSLFWTALDERPWLVVLEVHRRAWRR